MIIMKKIYNQVGKSGDLPFHQTFRVTAAMHNAIREHSEQQDILTQ
jgi:hypothetical protein